MKADLQSGVRKFIEIKENRAIDLEEILAKTEKLVDRVVANHKADLVRQFINSLPKDKQSETVKPTCCEIRCSIM